jgi:hypothetical protein
VKESEGSVENRRVAEDQDAVIGKALRWSFVLFACIATVIITVAVILNLPESEAEIRQTALDLPEVRQAPEQQLPIVPFTNVTAQTGINFVHQNGAYGDKLLPETMGGGCALFDYDGDGDCDILFVNSCRWPWDERANDAERTTMMLYRNDGDWQFVDVTAEAGLDVCFYGMGPAIGDMDNDGDLDVFITAVGRNHLFRNDGRHFVEVAERAGVAGAADSWSSGSTWIDYDNDGLLDLFVNNYIHWSKEIDLAQLFTLDGSSRAYGPPVSFEGAFPYVYHNDGDGKFSDVSEQMGVQVKNPATGVPVAKSLGIVPIDLDTDGWIDLVVANDTVQNFVFHNIKGQRFEEIGARAGVAFDSGGNARGAMGIDAACFRNDETVGLVIGNFANEMTALYVSMGGALQFLDASLATGLGPPTRIELTFAVIFVDVDLDGRLDILAVNGHLEDDISKVQQSQRYEQPPQLFWNAGPKHSSEFVRMPVENCGEDLHRAMVGRGASYADLDGDGDLDLLLTASGQAPRLLRNDQQVGHHWIRFHLKGTRCQRDANGARIELHVGDRVLPRQVTPTRGYLSQSEFPVTFGLGQDDRVDRVVVHWPDGSTQEIENPESDRLHVIEQPR